jgi:signal transduction histidine kinase
MEQIVGQDIHTLTRNHVTDSDQKLVIDLLRSKTHQEPNVKIKWGNKTLSVTAAPVHLESGAEVGTVAIFHDYTLEAQIDRMKSTFVSIASHELRTPLSAILGYAEMLQAGIGGPLTGEQHDMVSRILASTGQMLSLARNFLDQAQMEEGKLTLSFTAFSPGELVDNVSAMMEVIAQGKDIELTSHVADDLPEILTGNPERLQQILVNLTSNAIKFTKAGSVTLKAYLCDADHWALEVSDTGSGIPQEAQEYIFDPFQKVADDSQDGSTENYSGAGLGLSIVRQLVELMDGKISLKSQIGHGSTFTVVLPLTLSEVLTSR